MRSLSTKLQRLFHYWAEAGWFAVLRKVYVRFQGPRWSYFWKQRRVYQKIEPLWRQWVYHYWNRRSLPILVNSAESDAWHYTPQIDIFLFGKELSLIEQSLLSIQEQIYPHWKLHIFLQTSARQPSYRPSEVFSKKIDYHWIPENQSFITAFNQVLQEIVGEWIILQFAGDRLASHALYAVVQALQDEEADFVYSDDDKFQKNQKRFAPNFKPNWSPWYFLTHNYICNLCVLRCKLVQMVNGLHLEEGAFYNLLLRISEHLTAERILHIPQVLYHHWNDLPAKALAEKWYGLEAVVALRQIRAALQRRKMEAEVFLHPHYPLTTILPALQTAPLVSIIIPFRDQFPILHQAVTSILARSTYRHFEILLIDNQSQESTQRQVAQMLQEHSQLKLLHFSQPFNYSCINNFAVSHAKGDFLVLMNNDIEVLTPQWLEWMLAFAQFPEHGAIGVKLYYPNRLLQHGGIVTGIYGVAGHAHRYAPKEASGYGLCLASIREVSAVTAACMMIRKKLYHQVGGMDADHLAVAFNDVDFCLRIHQKGYSNLFLPTVEMVHYESFTRGKEITPAQQQRVQREIETMQKRWGARLLQDPFYNPNLTLDAEDFFLKFPPFTPRSTVL